MALRAKELEAMVAEATTRAPAGAPWEIQRIDLREEAILDPAESRSSISLERPPAPAAAAAAPAPAAPAVAAAPVAA